MRKSVVLAVATFIFGSLSTVQAADWVALPMSGMVLAIKDGKMRYVSDNGRFVFDGRAYDTWNQTFVESLDEARYSMSHIDLDKMRLSVDDLAPFVYGHGPKKITLFVDPFCPWCKKLVGAMQGLQDRYTFRILPIPVLGEQSKAVVRAMHCGADRAAAKRAAITGEGYELLREDTSKPCDVLALSKRLVAAQMLGIKGVPFLIRDDGLTRSGYTTEGLATWLTTAGAQ